MPSVLVTGASRGIGRTIALTLAAEGWEVFAGVRRSEDGEALVAGARAGQITPVTLDITDAAQVAALPETLGGSLDALVNNAGIVVAGPLEGVSLDDLRHQLEVNVVAQMAVTQAVLPLLRNVRGRIVLIGSVSGRVSAPSMGAYSASKFALEALADALRLELRPWEIPVALVEPGAIDTDLWRKAAEAAEDVEAGLSPEHRLLYASQLAGTRRLVTRVQKQTAPPEKVAAAVLHALTSERPKPRYLVGMDAKVQVAARAMLPTRAWDALLARLSGSH